MVDKIKYCLKNSTLKNITKMMTGTMLGQVISTLLVPVTTRIYGAEVYGNLAVLTSMSSLIVSFLGFGLAAAIMVEKTREEAEQTYKLAVNMTGFFVVIILGILYLLSPWMKIIKSTIDYMIMLVMLGISVITTNQTNMLYAWLNRNGRYNVLLFNPIITSISNNIISIVLGLMGFKNTGLFWGLLLSQIITLIHMFRCMDRITYKLKLKDIRSIIKRNKDFILYQYPASLMSSVVGNLPVQILSFCFGNTIVGYYSMSMKLLNIPSSLISNSLSRVYFKEAADRERRGANSREYTLKTCKIVSFVFLIPMALIILLGDILIPIVLGTEWALSVEYLKIMAVWNLFAIGINSTAGFSSVIGRQKVNMIISIVKLLVFPISMLAISYIFKTPQITIWTYAIVYSIINVVYYECLIGEESSLRWKFLKYNTLCLLVCVSMYLISIFLNMLF